MKILVIDSDPTVGELISLSVGVGWPEAQVLSVASSKKGLDILEQEQLDIVLLDLNNTDMNGFEVIKEIRLFSSVPLIALSIHNNEHDVVRALSRGADDYVVKPFRQMELLARIKTILRRLYLPSGETYSFANIHFIPNKHKIIKNDKEIALTATEVTILHKLVQNKRNCVTYRALAQAIWDDYYLGAESSIRVYIRSLREKLEDDAAAPKIILTRRSEGYILQI